MNNIAAPYNLSLADPPLDQTNDLKREMQKLMPAVHLMNIRSSPMSLRGLERDQKLRIMGFSSTEIEEMTGFKHSETTEEPECEVELVILDRDFPDQLKALNRRTEVEREAEYDRRMEYGIARGFVEDLG